MRISPPPQRVTDRVLNQALDEDLGQAGDITSKAIFSSDASSMASLVAREHGCIAGLPMAIRVFELVDPAVETDSTVDDGTMVDSGTVLATVGGPTLSLLAAERVALNTLGRLSGIATATRAAVDAVAGTAAKVVDTRKTTPGLRAFEKYAVRCGGGSNHRMGLYDAVMIKDNHIAAAGSIEHALRAVRSATGHMVTIEIEVDTLEQLDSVLSLNPDTHPDVVLLDNMSPADLARAVDAVGGRFITEASGGVTLNTIRDIAASGVDIISMGSLTHSSRALDVALDFD